MTHKEHKVGEKFKMDGITYEVKESIHCQGCALHTGENGCLDEDGERFEDCSLIAREDKKSVIFIKSLTPDPSPKGEGRHKHLND